MLFRSQVKGEACKECDAGQYRQSKEADGITATDATTCVGCPAGWSSEAGSTKCQSCEAGTYGQVKGEACKRSEERRVGKECRSRWSAEQ